MQKVRVARAAGGAGLPASRQHSCQPCSILCCPRLCLPPQLLHICRVCSSSVAQPRAAAPRQGKDGLARARCAQVRALPQGGAGGQGSSSAAATRAQGRGCVAAFTAAAAAAAAAALPAPPAGCPPPPLLLLATSRASKAAGVQSGSHSSMSLPNSASRYSSVTSPRPRFSLPLPLPLPLPSAGAKCASSSSSTPSPPSLSRSPTRFLEGRAFCPLALPAGASPGASPAPAPQSPLSLHTPNRQSPLL